MALTLTILGMAGLTLGLRVLGLTLPGTRLAPFVRRWLDSVPVAVFAALVAASLPGATPSDTLLRSFSLVLGGSLLARRAPLWLVLAVSLAAYLTARAALP